MCKQNNEYPSAPGYSLQLYPNQSNPTQQYPAGYIQPGYHLQQAGYNQPGYPPQQLYYPSQQLGYSSDGYNGMI